MSPVSPATVDYSAILTKAKAEHARCKALPATSDAEKISRYNCYRDMTADKFGALMSTKITDQTNDDANRLDNAETA